ncbi:MAG TPA: hypothetical protein VFU29_22325 [Chitinophagaceae bacterium]|nr:hypothetical protein [Chitinophagaceae bacterium]
MKFLLLAVFFAATFPSCEFPVKREKQTAEKSVSKIRNGIEISSKGIKVEQAFLLFDDGNLVPEGNKVKVKQNVKLRVICKGWKTKNGKVFLSGSEIVETSEKNVLLNDSTLFREYESGISPSDAEYISMDVVITQVTRLYDYYKIIFRINDLSDNRNIVEGYYKLYLD